MRSFGTHTPQLLPKQALRVPVPHCQDSVLAHFWYQGYIPPVFRFYPTGEYWTFLIPAFVHIPLHIPL